MLGAGRLDAGGASYIARTRGFVHIHVQIRIRTSQTPGISGSPLRGDFCSLSDSTESVAELRREQKVSGAGAGFEERLPGYVLAK